MGFVASKQLARPRCWRGEVGLGASKDPLNQWCISHISPYFSKIYQLELYFSFWGFPLIWRWCTYEVMNHALQISLLGKGTTTWGRHRVWSVNGFTFIVSPCEGVSSSLPHLPTDSVGSGYSLYLSLFEVGQKTGIWFLLWRRGFEPSISNARTTALWSVENCIYDL